MNTLIEDYMLISAHNTEDFERYVKFRVQDGWQPHGDAFNTARHTYNQPMVKYAYPHITNSDENCSDGTWVDDYLVWRRSREE